MARPRLPAVLVAAALALALAPAAARPAPADVREPAVAGQFYPGAADALRSTLQRLLAGAPGPAPARPLALVVPHAGYAYSGEIAAYGWRRASAPAPDLVVILGTNHTAAGFLGVAVSPARGFRTPLGVVEVDRDAADALLRADRDAVVDARPHAQEHSVEVQLPFAQVLFPRARILPLVVGSPDPERCERLGRALAQVLQGRNALVVASTDLSHYPAAREAAEVDRRVLAAMVSLDPAALRATIAAELARGVGGLGTCACGEGPVLAAMAYARASGATRGTLVRYGNSGDAPSGDRRRVVGYGAVAFEAGPAGDSPGAGAAPPPATAGAIDARARAALVAFARETLIRHFESGAVAAPRGLPALADEPRGVFVTLTRGGELRGCIGQLEATAPLGVTIGRMALAAALSDPRFPPVRREELPALHIEISVLTPAAPTTAAALVPGRDGVVLAKHGRSAVFLPQVATEQGWGRTELLDHLCEKAGLEGGCWREGATLSAFQAEVFGEARHP